MKYGDDPKQVHGKKPVYEKPELIDLLELHNGQGDMFCGFGSSADIMCSAGGVATNICDDGAAISG